MQKNKKILIVNNTGDYILKFRCELIQKLQSNDYQVYAAFPFDGAEIELAKNHKVECINFSLSSYSKNVFNELLTLIKLTRLIKKNDIGLILPFTIKPVIYSSIASYFCPSKVISTITGMGKIYTDSSLKFRLASKVSDLAYFIGFKKNIYVIFQNPDDQNHFTDKRILAKSKAKLVSGSGINLGNNPYHQRLNSDNLSFVMVARILKEKGVIEFCLAASNIIKKHNTKCTLVGGEVDGHEVTIEGKTLSDFCASNGINYMGHQNNVTNILRDHTVFVLPSYREGTPRSTLEALASGMPVITTKAPGTKETVKDNINGFLIEARSTSSLENAMGKIIHKTSNIEFMSKESRLLAEKKFNVDVVTSHYLDIINKASSNLT